MTFPSFEGEDLTGRSLSFPRDFSTATVALVAFGVEQRAQIESWLPFLDAEVVSRPQTQARLFAVLGRGMRLMKGAILGALRSGASGPEQRAATVLTFTDVDGFCRALDIGARDRVHLFVVRPGGAVATHVAGAYAVDAAAALREALA